MSTKHFKAYTRSRLHPLAGTPTLLTNQNHNKSLKITRHTAEMYHLLFINNPFLISSSTGKHTNRDHLQKLTTLKNTMNDISLTKHINFYLPQCTSKLLNCHCLNFCRVILKSLNLTQRAFNTIFLHIKQILINTNSE